MKENTKGRVTIISAKLTGLMEVSVTTPEQLAVLVETMSATLTLKEPVIVGKQRVQKRSLLLSAGDRRLQGRCHLHSRSLAHLHSRAASCAQHRSRRVRRGSLDIGLRLRRECDSTGGNGRARTERPGACPAAARLLGSTGGLEEEKRLRSSCRCWAHDGSDLGCNGDGRRSEELVGCRRSGNHHGELRESDHC